MYVLKIFDSTKENFTTFLIDSHELFDLSLFTLGSTREMAKGMVINAIRTCAYAGCRNDIEAKNQLNFSCRF